MAGTSRQERSSSRGTGRLGRSDAPKESFPRPGFDIFPGVLGLDRDCDGSVGRARCPGAAHWPSRTREEGSDPSEAGPVFRVSRRDARQGRRRAQQKTFPCRGHFHITCAHGQSGVVCPPTHRSVSEYRVILQASGEGARSRPLSLDPPPPLPPNNTRLRSTRPTKLLVAPARGTDTPPDIHAAESPASHPLGLLTRTPPLVHDVTCQLSAGCLAGGVARAQQRRQRRQRRRRRSPGKRTRRRGPARARPWERQGAKRRAGAGIGPGRGSRGRGARARGRHSPAATEYQVRPRRPPAPAAPDFPPRPHPIPSPNPPLLAPSPRPLRIAPDSPAPCLSSS